jgi:Mrp family chromosome partitioning ATPase
VLLDSPPVLPVVDARILAGHADGTIMVLRASQCLRAEVVQAYDDLTAAGARVLGTVLVGGRSSSRYGYGYGHYGYGPSPAARVVSSRALTAQHSTTDRSEPSSEGDSGLES